MANKAKSYAAWIFTGICIAALIWVFVIKCPKDCSGRGKCNKITKKCKCDTNYSGKDCKTHTYMGWQQMGKFTSNINTWSCGKGSCFDFKARTFDEILKYVKDSHPDYKYVMINTNQPDPANVNYLVARDVKDVPGYIPSDMTSGYQVWKLI